MLNNKENFNLLSSEELVIPVISYEKDLNGNKKSVKSNLSLNEIFLIKKLLFLDCQVLIHQHAHLLIYQDLNKFMIVSRKMV